MSDPLRRALEHLRDELGAHSEMISEILRLASDGAMSKEEALRQIWIAAGEDEQLAKSAEEIMLRSFGLETTSDLAKLPDRDELLKRWGFREEDLYYRPHPERPTVMLHPLLMGAIVELLQFDGDVPELRTDRLPEGGAVAVPVNTTARDPVVVGFMLRRARDQVTRELAAAQHDHDEKVAALVEAVGDTNDAARLMLRREAHRVVGVPGYQPGHAAALRTVEEPTASTLASLDFRERQRLAHLALTSTQGRRSISPVIATILIESLRDDGHAGISLGNEGEIRVEVEWCVRIDGGQAEQNPRFNFIDTAARTLLKKLRTYLSEEPSRGPLLLHVAPVNEISERVVGWRAVLRELPAA